MSRSLQIPLIPALAVSAVLLGATLAPAAARAQSVTPERALLNTVPAAKSATPMAFLTRFPAFDRGATRPVDGETALLVRVGGPAPAVKRPTQDIDGARALLGRWWPAEAHRTALSAESEQDVK